MKQTLLKKVKNKVRYLTDKQLQEIDEHLSLFDKSIKERFKDYKE